MNLALDVVQLSRLQFGLTAMYHFLFVPLTLGLAILLGIMETVYVMTGREIWREITMSYGLQVVCIRNCRIRGATACGNSSWINSLPFGKRSIRILGRCSSASISSRDRIGVSAP